MLTSNSTGAPNKGADEHREGKLSVGWIYFLLKAEPEPFCHRCSNKLLHSWQLQRGKSESERSSELSLFLSKQLSVLVQSLSHRGWKMHEKNVMAANLWHLNILIEMPKRKWQWYQKMPELTCHFALFSHTVNNLSKVIISKANWVPAPSLQPIHPISPPLSKQRHQGSSVCPWWPHSEELMSFS